MGSQLDLPGPGRVNSKSPKTVPSQPTQWKRKICPGSSDMRDSVTVMSKKGDIGYQERILRVINMLIISSSDDRIVIERDGGNSAVQPRTAFRVLVGAIAAGDSPEGRWRRVNARRFGHGGPYGPEGRGMDGRRRHRGWNVEGRPAAGSAGPGRDALIAGGNITTCSAPGGRSHRRPLSCPRRAAVVPDRRIRTSPESFELPRPRLRA